MQTKFDAYIAQYVGISDVFDYTIYIFYILDSFYMALSHELKHGEGDFSRSAFLHFVQKGFAIMMLHALK